jgi:hypothetical protein
VTAADCGIAPGFGWNGAATVACAVGECPGAPAVCAASHCCVPVLSCFGGVPKHHPAALMTASPR